MPIPKAKKQKGALRSFFSVHLVLHLRIEYGMGRKAHVQLIQKSLLKYKHWCKDYFSMHLEYFRAISYFIT